MQGSIRQRGQQSWELRVHAGRDPLTGRKTYVQRTVRGTKRDAEDALARLVTEINIGAHSATKSCTIGELLEEWFSHNEADAHFLEAADGEAADHLGEVIDAATSRGR